MHPELRRHPEYFKKEIVKLADNVYQAFGFAASNVYMLIGKDGLVIVDTTETTSAAKNILSEFRKITDLPVKKIILTHSHRDHVSGASIFSEGEDVQVIASSKSSDDPLIVQTKHSRPVKAMQVRTKRQFGIGLSYPDEIIGIGVGPGDRPLQGMGEGIMVPTTRIVRDKTKENFCGINLELIMAPGETPDHMVVWLPDSKILISGDNFYNSFPNLYAIRGTEYRDFDTWAETIDLLLSYRPEILAPGHTKAIFGSKEIQDILSDYRNAILHVVNETRKGMDEGLTIDQLAHSVKLPLNLARKPYLREYYGRVDYAVRAYFVGTMGWFDGNPTSLGQMAPDQEAESFIKLVGGTEIVVDAVEKAFNNKEFQWALQLVDRLIFSSKELEFAKKMKAKILREYAEEQINCPTRHYYIQSAKELESKS